MNALTLVHIALYPFKTMSVAMLLLSALEYMKGKENIRIKVGGKEFVVSRWFYSDIVKMFYDKEIQGANSRR